MSLSFRPVSLSSRSIPGRCLPKYCPRAAANVIDKFYVLGDCSFLVRILLLHFFFVCGVGWDWVHLVLRPLTGILHQPRMIDDDECEAVGGMRIGRGNRSTRRKPAPVPLCPHDLTWDRTQVAAVGSRRLTAWAMARPSIHLFDVK
jgi:hypothetical protein